MSITAAESLARGKTYLDEATENITFGEFGWAFEEAWHGMGWLLNALAETPAAAIATGPKGEWPRAGSLRELAAPVDKLPDEALVYRKFEALHQSLAGVQEQGGSKIGDPKIGDPKMGDKIAALVFGAWQFHDACGHRLKLVDERLRNKLVLTEASPGRLASPVMARRTALKVLAAGSLFPLAACKKVERDNRQATDDGGGDKGNSSGDDGSSATIASVKPIGSMHWETSDPFLFCAHHRDDYPEANGQMGPDASLAGRHLGRDFAENQPWRMYHGRQVPGFPRHPHRGFETVTVVRQGFLDHADSMGATARYGGGDVQWLTAGGGIQHAEMFPLLKQDDQNPLELFQIWLNLPRADKLVDPYFTMLWREKIPHLTLADDQGRQVSLTVIAGAFEEARPPSPPPNSWAARDDSDLAIWSLKLDAKAEFRLPAVQANTERSLYVHHGDGLHIGDQFVDNYHRVVIDGPGPITLKGGDTGPAEVLMLQGRPIGEPVAKRGPFVMNSQREIEEAYADYQQTQFGGWPWPKQGPVHPGERRRFAVHMDGMEDFPGGG